jgi:predicted nuclease with RNAse H fold
MTKTIEHLIHGVRVVGIDLSGPVNTKETALVWGHALGAGFDCYGQKLGVDDREILKIVQEQCARRPTIVGLDAPLSYEPGGGMRDGDSELQKKLIAKGMAPGSVMAPTMTRMCYLTLRGMAVSRMLTALEGQHPVSVVEVHPGAVFVLGGAPAHVVKEMKGDPHARYTLHQWLQEQTMLLLPPEVHLNDHLLAAAACALAAWRWSDGRSTWVHAAAPPAHPYDFAC